MKKTERINTNRTAKGHILALIETLKPGESLFTELPAKDVTSYAFKSGVKVKTEKMFSVCPKKLETKNLIKVTIL